MSPTFRIDVYREDLVRITKDIFATMLDSTVDPCVAEWVTGRNRVTATVFLAGSWQGAVLLECTPNQAFEFTVRMMPVPRPTDVNEDVRDTLCELVNMLGGNLKSVVPPGVALSMPSVVEGSDYAMRVCGKLSMSERIAFVCPWGIFWVTLIELFE